MPTPFSTAATTTSQTSFPMCWALAIVIFTIIFQYVFIRADAFSSTIFDAAFHCNFLVYLQKMKIYFLKNERTKTHKYRKVTAQSIKVHCVCQPVTNIGACGLGSVCWWCWLRVGKKLFSILLDLAQMLLYLFPDGRKGNRLWEGWWRSSMMLEALQTQYWW